MRRRLARARDRFIRFLRESAWAPVLGRAAAVAAGMLLLAVIGAGWLDTSLDLGPPKAEAASVRQRAHRASPATLPEASSSAVASATTTETPGAPAAAGAVAAHGRSTAGRGPVILNVANEQELQRLPGVGPAKAQAILALRDKLGGKFKRFEDLMRVRGIKRRSLERIKEHAVLDPPVPEEVVPPAPSASAAPSSSHPGGRASSPPPW